MRPVLGLVNDLVGMWMGHILQQVRLQGRDPLVVVGGLGQRICRKLGVLQKWMVGGYLQEIESGAVCGEDVETFMEDTFEFQKARIVGGDERAEVGVMGG